MGYYGSAKGTLKVGRVEGCKTKGQHFLLWF